MAWRSVTYAGAALLWAASRAIASAQMPKRIGACSNSTIKAIGTRFSDKLVEPKQGEFGEGTSIELGNGVYGISYDYVPAVGRSRIGDKVMTCLASVPKGCPKGDSRGKFYTTIEPAHPGIVDAAGSAAYVRWRLNASGVRGCLPSRC